LYNVLVDTIQIEEEIEMLPAPFFTLHLPPPSRMPSGGRLGAWGKLDSWFEIVACFFFFSLLGLFSSTPRHCPKPYHPVNPLAFPPSPCRPSRATF
jgi:hypothetical protein